MQIAARKELHQKIHRTLLTAQKSMFMSA